MMRICWIWATTPGSGVKSGGGCGAQAMATRAMPAESADVLYDFGGARRFPNARRAQPLRVSQLDRLCRMVKLRAYGDHGGHGDATSHQTRRAAGRRGCDRPGGPAAVRARPSEGT